MRVFMSILTAAAILHGVPSFMPVESPGATHVIQTPNQAQWGTAPPLLPPGAQLAVLAGDPTKPLPYTIRLKFPAHYAIPAHSHPTDENVIVTMGTLTFGMGDKLTKENVSNKTLGPGGFALMPANMNHFAFAGPQETTIVLFGKGPVEFKYVNPADDPRTAKIATK